MSAIDTRFAHPLDGGPFGLVLHPLPQSRSEHREWDVAFAAAFRLGPDVPRVSALLTRMERQILRALWVAAPEPVPALTLNLLREQRRRGGGQSAIHIIEAHLYRLRQRLAAAVPEMEITTMDRGTRSGCVRAYLLRRRASA